MSFLLDCVGENFLQTLLCSKSDKVTDNKTSSKTIDVVIVSTASTLFELTILNYVAATGYTEYYFDENTGKVCR